ncbi:MAG: hypothetical protein KDA24_22300, partial [Deltaproteobacteria bacterium]|nr:hypothetical protein [Deltaproteobacteria bacterium]
GRVATESFEAFVSWSTGLAALDRGAMEDARKALEESLGHDDRFNLATTMLGELRERLKTLDARRAEASSEQTKTMMARLAELKASNGPYDPLQTELVPVTAVAASPQNARTVSTIAGALMDLGLPEELRIGGPTGVYSINEWAMYSYTMAQQWLGRRSDYLTYGNAFLERYPNSVMATAFSSGLQNLLAMMEEEEAGRPLIAQARVEALSHAHKTRCTSELDPAGRLESCRTWFRDSDAASIVLDGDSEEMWARAAARAGQIDEIEQILARSRAREQYGEAAEDIGKMLERSRKDAADADKALAKLAEASKPYNVVRVARDLADAGRFDEAFAALDEGIARFGETDDFFQYDIGLCTKVGRRARAEAALKRWEASAAASPEITVQASTARQVLEWDENTRYAGEADAQALLQLAVGMLKIGRYKEAGDAYVELATKYPSYSSMDAPTALSSAGNMYYRSWEMEAARASFQRVIDEYPEHDSARSAQSMMTLLPE